MAHRCTIGCVCADIVLAIVTGMQMRIVGGAKVLLLSDFGGNNNGCDGCVCAADDCDDDDDEFGSMPLTLRMEHRVMTGGERYRERRRTKVEVSSVCCSLNDVGLGSPSRLALALYAQEPANLPNPSASSLTQSRARLPWPVSQSILSVSVSLSLITSDCAFSRHKFAILASRVCLFC